MEGVAHLEPEELGGWRGFKDGSFFMKLVRRSFKDYFERANADYFKSKYPGKSCEFVAHRLTLVAARNAAALGIATGSAISADAVFALLTGAEGGIGLPANLALAGAAIMSEVILLAKIQLQLVANLAKINGIALDPDDPEDAIMILFFATGGALTGALTKPEATAAMEFVERLGQRVGVGLLRKAILRYAVPLVSIGISSGWNYVSTRSVGRIAQRSLGRRSTELTLKPVAG